MLNQKKASFPHAVYGCSWSNHGSEISVRQGAITLYKHCFCYSCQKCPCVPTAFLSTNLGWDNPGPTCSPDKAICLPTPARLWQHKSILGAWCCSTDRLKWRDGFCKPLKKLMLSVCCQVYTCSWQQNQAWLTALGCAVDSFCSPSCLVWFLLWSDSHRGQRVSCIWKRHLCMHRHLLTPTSSCAPWPWLIM